MLCHRIDTWDALCPNRQSVSWQGLPQKLCWGVVPDRSVAQVQLCEASVCRLLVNPCYASLPASRQAFRQIKISDKKIEESGVRDIPLFRGPCEEDGAQNLKRIKQIWVELYFPQLRQLRQVTWGLTSADVRLTSGLTWQLRTVRVSWWVTYLLCLGRYEYW